MSICMNKIIYTVTYLRGDMRIITATPANIAYSSCRYSETNANTI